MSLGLVLLLGLLQPGSALDQARALMAAGRPVEARQVLAKLDRKAPPVAHLSGVLHFNAREYAQAIDDLKLAVASETPSSAAWHESTQLLGRSYYLSGRLLDAIPWLEKAHADAADSVEVLYMLGNSYLQARRPDDARAAFAGMFGVGPGSAAAHLLNAQMMVRQELEPDAGRELARALELDPKIAGAHFLLGELAISNGDFDRAVAELNKEIATNPNFAPAYWRLGDAYARQERWNDAIPELQKSIWLNQTFSGPYILLGKAYLKQGELANAEGVLRRALQMDPQNSSAHYLLGRTLIQAGRTEEGKQLLLRSRELRKEP